MNDNKNPAAKILYGPYLKVLIVVLFLELGEKMSERFLPIYLLALSGSSFIVGLGNALDNFIGALYSLPGGYLSDRFGYKKSLIFFSLLTMLGYAIVLVLPTWQGVLVGAILFTSWGSISLPGIMTAVSKTLPKNKSTLGVTLHSLIKRFPMAIGPLIGAAFLDFYGEKSGIRYGFLFALILTGVFVVWQILFIKDDPVLGGHQSTLNPKKLFALMSPDLKKLLLSDILIRFAEQIPYAFAVIWCLKVVGISASQFGLLTAIEMLTAVVIYIPVAYWVEKTNSKKPFIAITFGFFSLFPLVLFYSRSFEALIFAFFIRGLKEFGEPTRKALILDFAQGPKQGSLYGAYYLIRDVVVSLAALAGGMLWQISPGVNFFVATAFGLFATLYFIVFCKE